MMSNRTIKKKLHRILNALAYVKLTIVGVPQVVKLTLNYTLNDLISQQFLLLLKNYVGII